MPFIGRYASTLERLDITRFANPKADLRADDIICQLCEARMIIRHGFVMRPHFAHIKACPMDYACHPEREEHRLGKYMVSRLLEQREECAGALIELEYPIHARKRIADIMVTFTQGHRMVVEIQLASITPGQLHARTNDYFEEGVDVVWFLGKEANTPGNRTWCSDTLGWYGVLSFEDYKTVSVVLTDPDAPVPSA